jgi:hypothetical protein
MRAAATIVFSGSFRPESFLEFVAHRGGRLALCTRLEASGPDQITVSVAGEPDLIDAFEMACSLGPLDCLVRDVARRAAGPFW